MSTFINDNLTLAVLAPLALAAIALLLAGYLFMALRRYRRDQKIVMGSAGERDVIAHANALEFHVGELSRDINHLSAELKQTEKSLGDCLTFRSVIRYDAYNDLSGMQSTSVALLDAQFSGIIMSSIQSRDHARIYVKEVRHGESREQLSPEEIQVLKEAMGLRSRKLSRVAGGAGDE